MVDMKQAGGCAEEETLRKNVFIICLSFLCFLVPPHHWHKLHHNGKVW